MKTSSARSRKNLANAASTTPAIPPPISPSGAVRGRRSSSTPAAACCAKPPVAPRSARRFARIFPPWPWPKSSVTELFWRSGYLVAIFAGLLLASRVSQNQPRRFRVDCAGADAVRGARQNRRGRLSRRLRQRTGVLARVALLAAADSGGGLSHSRLAGACRRIVALFSGAWVWLVSRFQISSSNWAGRLRWTLTGAAAWVALELLRGWLFSGFPWSFLGVSQYQLVPLIQIAAVTGVYGVSFLVVWFSLALYSAAEMIFRHPVQTPRLAGGNRFAADRHRAAVRRRTILDEPQPRLPTRRSNRISARHARSTQHSANAHLVCQTEDEKRFAELLAVSQRAMTNRPDLLLWPESAVPMFDGVYRHHQPVCADQSRLPSSSTATTRSSSRTRRIISTPLSHPARRAVQRRLSQAEAGHFRRICSARALAAVSEMVHAHRRRLDARRQTGDF